VATTTVLPPKKDVMVALIQRSSVYIHLDPRREGVRVPPWFRNQPQLVLQVGLNMAIPIADLAVEDDAVSCTLSFSRSPHFCYVPWRAVYALMGEDGKGMVWPDDIPPEVAAQQAEQARKERAKERVKIAPTSAGKAKASTKPTPIGIAAMDKSSDTASPVQNAGKASKPVDSKEGAMREDRAGSDDSRRKKDSKRPLPPYLRVVK
jgi:stringent starvation protein B